MYMFLVQISFDAGISPVSLGKEANMPFFETSTLDLTTALETCAMTTPYDILRKLCGLSQQDAADYHHARLDTVVSWCNGRRNAPVSALDELRELYEKMADAGDELAQIISLTNDRDERGNALYTLGLPLDGHDSIACGFPTISAHETAIAIAISKLPLSANIRLVPRQRGAIPTAVVIDSSFPQDHHHRKEVQMQEPLTAAAGAVFQGRIQLTREGPQASYNVQLDLANNTLTQTDIRFFKGKDEDVARHWLEQEASARGFTNYKFSRVDENGDEMPTKGGLQVQVTEPRRGSPRR
jgi:hypothetical protein